MQKIVGFFPNFYSLGETLPAINIAESYRDKGGKIIFFSNTRRYEKLVEESGFKLVKLPKIWERYKDFKTNIEKIKKNWQKKKLENRVYYFYSKDVIEKAVEDEIKVFKKYNVDLLVSFFNPTNKISTQVLNIPLIVIISGTSIPIYYSSGYVTFPDNYENIFTKIVPSKIKNNLAARILLNSKKKIRFFNKIAKKYNIKKFRTLNDLLLGDINFICDDINFLGIEQSQRFPEQNFVGPILGRDFGEKKQKLDEDVKKFLRGKNRSILVTMGSVLDRNFFVRILKDLSETDYNIIAVHHIKYKKIFPDFGENILLKKSVSSIKEINKNVDLLIIHGGRGTVYTAAYSGKPVIGIPTQLEQQFNLDCLVRKGVGIRISKKFYKKEELLNSIEKIFNNYEEYKRKAEELAKKIQPTKSCERITDNLIKVVKGL